MWKLLTAPLWLPIALFSAPDKRGNRWTNQDNNVFFGAPYPKGESFGDPANPFKDDFTDD
jgi:hypothetical protein